jgi:hypothetical protein
MKPEEVKEAIARWPTHIARKGGRSTSIAKRKAAVENIAKARAARAEKRKKALGK